jgi:hypothetical protein
MIHAKTFRSPLKATPPPVIREAACDNPADCGERFLLREEYIRRLAEFNAVAVRHRMVLRTGMQGPAADTSWRAFREKCAASNAAWARYRKHLSNHGCKHGAVEIATAA